MILNIVIILNTGFVIGIMITVTITVNVTPGQPDLTCIAMLIHRRLKFKQMCFTKKQLLRSMLYLHLVYC